MTKKHVLYASMVFLMLFAYQDCTTGGFNVIVGSSETSFSLASTNADIVWSMKSAKPGLSLARLSQVQRWTDSSGLGISLYPPLIANSVQLDLDKAPTSQATDQGSLVYFGEGSSLTNLVGDLSVFLGQEYTIALYVRSVQIPTSDPQLTRIFEFLPADNSASGDLGLDFYNIGNGKVQINAFTYFDQTASATSYVQLPSSALDSGFGIVIRHTNDPTKTTVAVNGQSGTLSVVGSPPLIGNVTRKLGFHGITYGPMGSFALGEIGIWKSAISEDDAKTYSMILQQSFELGGTTLTLPGGTGTTGSSSGFGKIQANFNVCMNCHSEVSSVNSIRSAVGNDGITPWIVVGDPANSLMIKALQHQAGALAMPKDNPALTADQISQISNWIQQGAN